MIRVQKLLNKWSTQASWGRYLVSPILLILFINHGFNPIPIIARATDSKKPETTQVDLLQKSISTELIYLPVIYSKKPQLPRVNAPYTNGQIRSAETAITWFGLVTPDENYADVRVGYNAEELWVNVTVIDRFLWYDPNPALDNLTDWDAVSLYLDLTNGTGENSVEDAYRFDAQLNWWEPRENFQAVFQGSGNIWNKISIPFSTISGWRGNAPNDDHGDQGWSITYKIPFTSLGLSNPPPQGTVWRMSIRLYDRDDSIGSPIPVKTWPSAIMAPGKPDTWGELAFGLPFYTPPIGATPGHTVTIRHKLNGAEVIDGMVGGGTECGKGIENSSWKEWGQLNYAGAEQVNVQNERDVSDWVCFSKFYITFPLADIPPGKVIISAELILHSIGNAGGGEWGDPPNSLIQVLMVNDDWNESIINWNNAPPAMENVSQAWVEPIVDWPGSPGVPRTWDLSYGVNKAYQAVEPLRLVLYSADSDYHTGRYFAASETGDYIAEGRPTLNVNWSDP